MINDRLIDQAYSDLNATCGGLREDYFGLLYLEQEHAVPREKALNQIALGGKDYGVDGFHFDEARRNLYIFQFKYTSAHGQVRFPDWQHTTQGERLVQKELRKTLLKYKLHTDQDLFDRAYAYVKQYY